MGRRKHKSKVKFHPVVQGYVEVAGNTIDLLRSTPEPRGRLIEAMLRIREAHSGECSAEEAFRAAQAIDIEKEDPFLCLIFLELWTNLSIRENRVAEAEALVNRARFLVSEDTPPELRAGVWMSEGIVLAAGSDKEGRARCIEKAIAELPLDSKRRKIVVWDRAIRLGQLGQGTEVEEDLAWLEMQCDEVFLPSRIAFVRLCNCVETGRAQEAERYLEEVLRDKMLASFSKAYLSTAQTTLILFLGRGESAAGEDEWPDWAASTQALLERHPEDALRLARKTIARSSLKGGGIGFASHALMRAELAAGNGSAARHLLDLRWQRGNAHYLDGLFLSRVERLSGNEAVAAQHFAAAIAACERYGADARLQFELRLACELAPDEVMRLTRRALGLVSTVRGEALPEYRSPRTGSAARGTARLLGRSKTMARVRSAIDQLSVVDVPVLITGETGTGKEMAARAIHEAGPRADEPFLAINCGAIAESLLESELFGYERGAFTGATRARQGLFETAGTGTVFLDEIGEISLRLQVVLLRVLETREIRPVGSARTRPIACRILAATNAPLDQLVDEGQFRRDLLHRVSRMNVRMPPLRELGEDVLMLAGHFLGEGRPDGVRPIMSVALKESLLHRPWLGNVRELRNTIERMRLLNSDKLSYDIGDIEVEVTGQARPAKAVIEPTPSRTASTPATETADTPDAVTNFLRGGRSSLRRRERLRQLFRNHKRLTRREIIALLRVAPNTATRDLKILCDEGFVEKVRPSASPATHYFSLCEPSEKRFK